MASNPSVELDALISREQAENAFGDALSLFVGRGRRYSVEQLAKGIGCKPKTIYDFKSYPSGHPDHRPLHFGLTLSIMKFLGAEFVNEWLPLADQHAIDTGPIDHDGLAAECIDFAAEHARARHPKSPGGVDIVECEDKSLKAKRPKLKVAV